MVPKGIFITLEGPDGSGKSTQVENIKEFFTKAGRDVVVSREPGGTPISEKLRGIVLDADHSEMDDVTEMFIYAAARAQHVAEKIKPALESGAVVVCDRFVDSSIAYQGYGRGLGDQVEEVNRYATSGLEPNVTFFMDLDPEIGRSRIGKDVRDRLEQQKMDFHYRVYEGYKALAAKYPERIMRIDAAKTIDEIKAEIETKLSSL
ncbi:MULTISPECIES: dTMP kinase [Mogibacterium]|uniref:Thymidylate kinase n=2 Tax=Mogibacterium timidum TaxID=35519 RepID=X8IVV6_9FIRM|nr:MULTISPECIES: dTMP kinase [Mogibacterium]EUC53339.1 dTMP kinase [Mogibacterium timidum ATCC 33093]NWO23543.1 dTMP kinase [Mogibacterium timidum]